MLAKLPNTKQTQERQKTEDLSDENHCPSEMSPVSALPLVLKAETDWSPESDFLSILLAINIYNLYFTTLNSSILCMVRSSLWDAVTRKNTIISISVLIIVWAWQ